MVLYSVYFIIFYMAALNDFSWSPFKYCFIRQRSTYL